MVLPMISGNTLNFYDAPSDPCLAGGNSVGVKGCEGLNAPPGQIQVFQTQLVGVLADGDLAPLPAIWTWSSSFNGTSGGIYAVLSERPVDPGSGTGGISVTSINGVPQRPPTVSCAAYPTMLWPPDGKAAVVTISGSVLPGSEVIPISGTSYLVTDEYGQIQPYGDVTVNTGGSYSFGISLIASREGNDKDGRMYFITVVAGDALGNLGSCSVAVTVPHDQG